uniref:Reverse transcriptase domain-containing protein n=1 Tax=Arundo donax TaxID=35708 RepID=A0A0A8ZIZ9_ARUDO
MFVRNMARIFHQRRMPALLIKLGITKTFDSVRWEYLLTLMQHIAFPVKWCDWISMLLATSSSRVLMNGIPNPPLNHSRGLQQGDPLSPLLFILAIDSLQRPLELATSSGILSPLRGRTPRMRISMYANDAAIFVNPTKEDLAALAEVLNLFAKAMGLRTNFHKSLVAPIDVMALTSMTSFATF